MLERHLCESCGGTTERDGNFYICQYCGTKWAIITEDAMQVKLQNAWEALRCNEFDKASELFEGIIIDNNNAKRESDSFEAYWGKALADNGIVFVNDYREDKKVPTCNNITENSFVENSDVKKAIALAPKDVSENYSFLAEKIEKIRVEWLEKARKEEPYDVFICFKDSDKEHNIERTNDSYAAQELYTELVKEGYKVFFSRVSLRDKISEQYEPYIYNALKTAKVMIVYGEKPEYFNAVWLKNEWNRFRMRIEKGEKHKNSLVVVYKNMDANDLPAALKSRQCLNAGDMMFYPTLSSHVKKVIELSAQNVHLDRIKVQGGQMGKKASSLSVNSVKTREIGAGAIAETDISEKQSIALINTYLRAHDWRAAKKLIEDALFDNPGCAEAIWCQILANSQATDEADLSRKLADQKSKFNDFGLLEKLLNCATKDFATKTLDMFYDVNYALDELHTKALEHILPYSYPNRDKKIRASFDKAINSVHTKAFDLLLGTLNSDEVDRYIAYNHSMVKATSDLTVKKKYLKNVLAVDEGNVEALRTVVEVDIFSGVSVKTIKTDFEALLTYADDADKEVNFAITCALSEKCVLNSENIAFTREVLRYYNANIFNLKNLLMKFSNKLLKLGKQSEVEYYCNLVLSVDKNCADAYWYICLAKIGAKSDEDVVKSSKSIRKCLEFNKYLTLVDNERRNNCVKLAQQQEKTFNNAIANLNIEIQRSNDKIAGYHQSIASNQSVIEQKTQKGEKHLKFAKIALRSMILAIIVGIIGIVMVASEIGGFSYVFIAIAYISFFVYMALGVYLAFAAGKIDSIFTFLILPYVALAAPFLVWRRGQSDYKQVKQEALGKNETLQSYIAEENENIKRLEEQIKVIKNELNY